jgi:hypothetical protein
VTGSTNKRHYILEKFSGQLKEVPDRAFVSLHDLKPPRNCQLYTHFGDTACPATF